MCAFSLQQRYDAVVCLFSAIGYVRTLDRMQAALVCFREHLAPGGVIVVEPWFAPGGLDVARRQEHRRRRGRARDEDEPGGRRRADVAAVLRDRIENAAGIRHASEVHELGLFTTGEMIDAFWQAGLDVDHDPKGLSDRGLFVARVVVS
jgi:hypothetical protein